MVAGRDNLIADILFRVYPQDKSKFQVEGLTYSDKGHIDYLTFKKVYKGLRSWILQNGTFILGSRSPNTRRQWRRMQPRVHVILGQELN